jgi:hypothetical protein
MRRIFTILAVVLMVGTFAYAQTAPAGQMEKPKAAKSATKAPKATTAHGAIVKADATSVTLKTKAGEESFAVNADTKITQSGKAITAADLTAGENATVSYTKSGDQMTATKIAVAAKKAPKAPKTPKEPKK